MPRKYTVQLKDVQVPDREDRLGWELEPGKALGGDAEGNPTNIDIGGASRPASNMWNGVNDTNQALSSGTAKTVVSVSVNFAQATSKKRVMTTVGAVINVPAIATGTLRLQILRDGVNLSPTAYDRTFNLSTTGGTDTMVYFGAIRNDSDATAGAHTYSVVATLTVTAGTPTVTVKQADITVDEHPQ